METTGAEPKISVIIPVYNGGQDFYRCLTSLKASEMTPHELIVVSDGDTDGSWLVAEKFGATVIKRTQSQGPAKARNQGANIATGEILFFVDADVEVHPDTLTKVAQAFKQQPDLAALIGSYDDAPGAKNFLSQYKNLIHHYTHQKASQTASTFWGACGAIRRDIFFAVGGFDPSYRFPCVEDIELGYRLKRAGYHIGLFKEIQVKHLKRWEVYSLLRAEIFYRAIPWTSLILRHNQFINDLNLDWSNRVSVVLVYLLVMSLTSCLLWTPALVVALVCAGLLLQINAPVYQFFYRKRGLLFALQTIPWHWLYYFYAGFSFVIGWTRYHLDESKTGQPDFARVVRKISI